MYISIFLITRWFLSYIQKFSNTYRLIKFKFWNIYKNYTNLILSTFNYLRIFIGFWQMGKW